MRMAVNNPIPADGQRPLLAGYSGNGLFLGRLVCARQQTVSN